MDISTRTKIDAIWQGMWDNGMADAKTNITQITYLLFIKMLDDAQIKKEANANAFGVKVKNPTFPEGTFAEDKDEDGNVIDTIAYEDLRWHNFVHFSTEKMFHIVKDYVFKFIREMHNGEDNAFSRFMTDAKLDIPSGKILEKVIRGLDDNELNLDNKEIMGDVYEYLLAKLSVNGTNGQFRTPRHIINMMVHLMQPKLGEKICEIKTQLLKLIDQDTTDDNYSKSFDYRVSIIQLSLLDDAVDSSRQQGQLLKTAQALLAKASIQDIFDKKDILKQLADEDYYMDLDFFELEKVKEEVGPLIKYLRGEDEGDKISNFNDKIQTKERDVKYDFDNFKTYREKIITYLQKHFGELESVKKIINLDELDSNDLNELQAVLDSLKTPETGEDEEFKSTQELIIFIRKIVGLDKKAIDEKCAKFLNINDFNKEQRQLINLIIDFAIRNGNVTKDDLVNTEPFSDIEIPELFDNELAPILQLVAMFTNSLNVAA